MPISAVKNGIASFEAQTPNRSSRPRTSIAAKKKRDALRQQQQQSQDRVHTGTQSPGRTVSQIKKPANDANTGTSSNSTSTSTTVTASENRKSRIRLSQQQIRENVPNLVEKRKVLTRRDRRSIQQKQRQRQSSNSDDNGVSRRRAATTIQSDIKPGDKSSSNGSDHGFHNSPERWSKIQHRMRQKGFEHVGTKKMGDLKSSNNNDDSSIGRRQPSLGTNATTSINSGVTSFTRNTSTNNNIATARLKGENYVKGKATASRTINKMMSATVSLSSKNRRQRQETSASQSTEGTISDRLHLRNYATKNSIGNDHSPSRHSLSYHSPSHHSPTNERQQHYGGNGIDNGISQQQLESPLESATDDDATLTSVHRIMQDKNRNGHTNQSTYETLESQYNVSSSGRNTYNGTSLQASYDSSVGPSWNPPSSHIKQGGNRKIAAGTRDIFKANDIGFGDTSKNGRSIWIEEEKSEKSRIRTVSSSDYDTDGDVSKTSRQSTHFVEGPVHSQNTDVNDFFTSSRFSQTVSNNTTSNNDMNSNNNSNIANNNTSSNHRRIDDDDERTFDYGDRDDDSNGSISYATRRRKDADRRARLAASSNENNKLGQSIHQQIGSTDENNGEPLLLNKDDMEHFTMKDSPGLRLSAGVAGVATIGCIAFGPVGLLIGVAAGGLGFGFMQIPEEERTKIQAKAEKAVHNFQEKACDASEAMSSSCLNSYQDSGVADHVPQCISSNVADHLPNCPSAGTAKSENLCNKGRNPGSVPLKAHSDHNDPAHSSPSLSGPIMETAKPTSMSNNDRLRHKKVACLRNLRIPSISQIHGLEPTSQPKAWLDVVASANTSSEQKNEATEEILLLAKDKRRAKIFLDEGILDYIIWTLSRYFEKLEVVGKTTNWAFPEISANEKAASNLAAQCCVTLGKAHCAAIHTEGDLLLMSMYERGTVPEERQVAQMLHEIPHHARVTKTNDPTIVQPSKEVFSLRQLTLQQAEELARSIKAVADGQL